MKADLPGTVRTIAQFLSIELDQALLALVVEQPKLRYLVGEDAKRVVAARQAMTDEARVDFEQEMSLDDYAERYF